MKKLIFILTVLVGSGVLILLSFSRENSGGKEDAANIDFSEGEKPYTWNTDEKKFIETSLTGSENRADTSYLRRFSPIDNIYYRSTDRKPLTHEKKGGVNIITFGSGLFVCNIQTGLEKYEFHLNDMTLVPKGRGGFIIDTTQQQTKIFSFDTFLDIRLVTGEERSTVAHFTLFPSLLFRHDPKNTLELKEADILRISIIDSIRYLDIKTEGDRKMLFSGNDAEKDDLFLTETQKDITDRINAFTKLSISLHEQDSKQLQDSSFFNTSNSLLINGSKKEILLKNSLVGNIKGFLINPKKTFYKTEIYAILSEMKDLSPKVYADGISILREYYYVTAFSHFASKDNLFDFSGQESPLLTETEKIITNNTQTKQGEYYTHLSDLFSVYYFLPLSQKDLNNSFEDILQKILDNKVLTKDEFLPFTFFVTQYLSTGPVIPNEDTMNIVSHLFQITDDYYMDKKSDGSKLTSIISTTFYNYTKIFTKLYNVFSTTFTDKTPEGLLLKKEYIEGENTNLEQSFVDTFAKVTDAAKKDIENKKDMLYSNGSLQSNSQIIDSYTLLKNTLKSFDILTSMFSNYPGYLNDFHLNDSNRSAKGILVDKGTEMSTEILGAYLKKFNNLDISSLRVINDFQKDGFYEIQVNILGSAFSFKLWEQNHILADISYTDTFGKKHTFPNITIPLDQKEEQLKELSVSSDDPALQYKYDFRNFFETTFLKGDTGALPSTGTETTAPATDLPAASPEIQLFIQKELLDKDFKNIADFLPIGFKNINASISEGNYVIELNDINKAFAGGGNTYSVELSGKYIFNRHSFSKLSLKIKNGSVAGSYELGGTPIEIFPARISLLSLPDALKDMGYYLDAIQSSYSNQQSIIVDLTGKKVLLDNVPFIPKFPTP
ncbi:MAG: hypothetical protein PHH16_03560 [Candidatus Gracilibacteria bacterium]|nr:hypothetical protein [Candidatus Gracilibacteria bacterium]